GARLILGLAFVQPDQWVPVSASPSLPVLLFAIGIAALTAIVFGVAPAYLTSRADPLDAMRGGGTASSRATRAQRGIREGFVVVQAALSVVLLSAAGMLGQSLRNLRHGDFGFETSDRYVVAIDTKIANPPPNEIGARVRGMEERLRAIPGVKTVSAALYAPL